MFEPSEHPRIFGCPPGADFPKALIDGLLARLGDSPPDQLARVEIIVNTRRMQRRIWQLFDEGRTRLLPRIRLVTDLASDPIKYRMPAAVSPLRRRLELSQLIARLLDKEPDLAPRSALFDLSDSLSLLLDEMHDEGVSPSDIQALDLTDRSGHWQRSQKFLSIISHFFDTNSGQVPNQTSRQRQVIKYHIDNWATDPPEHPVIIAGSTGSRGSTALLMQAVASLPQGAVILPGFDFDLPATVWDQLDDPMTSEDHPQYRLHRVMESAGISAKNVLPWHELSTPPAPFRNQLISLALRPAPVTSQWMLEGPLLKNVAEGTSNMALVEAPSERVEAVIIALALRKAAESGQTAALVTPDRMLTRRVRAALDRWRIEPDFSVGEPLDQTAPGRLLRHVSELFGKPLTAEALLILLKHPLVNSGGAERGQHLLWTREFELKIRRYGPPFPTRADILEWASKGQETQDRFHWATWVANNICGHEDVGQSSLTDHLERHLAIAFALAAGPEHDGPGSLWDGPAGAEARRQVEELIREAPYGGTTGATDYAILIHGVLKRGEVRDPVRPHPNIMIWGTLEARVQGADLVILGGLNDGVWPALPAPDPWLNREMRHKVGLLVPERKIGLSAHDFQQAVAAKEVIITRSVRDAETQTVPSRWLNRMTNLMEGMSAEGQAALKGMRARCQEWLDIFTALEAPGRCKPEPRPSPMPPIKARPKTLSVTSITRLIRDPYAIYAQYVLRLNQLDPLRQSPDAPLRGVVLHSVFETFIRDVDMSLDHESLKSRLLAITDTVLADEAPWPASRVLWRSKIDRVADVFLDDEIKRISLAKPVALEQMGELRFNDLDFILKAKADRIDRTASGRYVVYDYKTGSLPTKPQLRYFDKQLLLEALMVEEGAFKTLAAGLVEQVSHIGLGAKPKFEPVAIEPGEIQQIRAELLELITKFQSENQGYTSRRAMAEMRFAGNFDHLARFGEWDETQAPDPQEVGR